MKRKNLTAFNLNKKSISSLTYEKVKGAGFSCGPSCFCKTAAANNLTIGNCQLCQPL
ncbi:hypothetical protein [Kordia jejudonensis]|uniref:hypothetical protein n=1 Tax=Kordia jejudonensis TaxID=1348245 RepID=UPI0012E0B034|nr:hypothetical protein [Kordia jejudonensis]